MVSIAGRTSVLVATMLVASCYASTQGGGAGDGDVAEVVTDGTEEGMPGDAVDGASDEASPEAASWFLRVGGASHFLHLSDMIELFGGDSLLVGYAPNGSWEDLWAARLTPDGELSWERWAIGVLRQFANSLVPRTGGGFLVIGGDDYRDWSGAAAFAFDGDGRPEWARAFGGTGEWFDVAALPDGDFVAVGGVAAEGDPPGERARPWACRLDADGRSAWQRRYEVASATAVSIVASTGGALTVAVLVATPTGDGGRRTPVLMRLDERGNVLWAWDVGVESNEPVRPRLTALPDGETALIWNDELLVFGEDGAWRHGWRLASPTNLVLVDATAVGDGIALVGRDDVGGWVGVLGHDGALRWQASVAGEVEQDLARVVRSEHDGGLTFFGGTIASTWVLHLPSDGRFDGSCRELSAGTASVAPDVSLPVAWRTVDSVETAFVPTEEPLEAGDDDLPIETVCRGTR